jgi:hypothetical protein
MIFFSSFGFVAVVLGNPETQTVSHSFPKLCAALQRKFGSRREGALELTKVRLFRMQSARADTDRLSVICLGFWALKNFLEAGIGAEWIPLPTQAEFGQRDAPFECGQHSRGSNEQPLE